MPIQSTLSLQIDSVVTARMVHSSQHLTQGLTRTQGRVSQNVNIPAQRTQAFFTLKEYSQIDLMSTVSGVKTDLFQKLNSGAGGKARKEERVILTDSPVLWALTLLEKTAVHIPSPN